MGWLRQLLALFYIASGRFLLATNKFVEPVPGA